MGTINKALILGTLALMINDTGDNIAQITSTGDNEPPITDTSANEPLM
jgi:hypothetical protein